jgi:hypothetical protein
MCSGPPKIVESCRAKQRCLDAQDPEAGTMVESEAARCDGSKPGALQPLFFLEWAKRTRGSADGQTPAGPHLQWPRGRIRGPTQLSTCASPLGLMSTMDLADTDDPRPRSP